MNSELVQQAPKHPQDDDDRSLQADAVDQEASRWVRLGSGDQKREP